MSKLHPLLNLYNGLAALIAVSFVNLFLNPCWESTVGFACTIGFSSFVLWLNPMRKQEVQRSEFDKLKEELQSVRDQFTQLKIKIGFQRTA